jgi:hypothetical protein
MYRRCFSCDETGKRSSLGTGSSHDPGDRFIVFLALGVNTVFLEVRSLEDWRNAIGPAIRNKKNLQPSIHSCEAVNALREKLILT